MADDASDLETLDHTRRGFVEVRLESLSRVGGRPFCILEPLTCHWAPSTPVTFHVRMRLLELQSDAPKWTAMTATKTINATNRRDHLLPHGIGSGLMIEGRTDHYVTPPGPLTPFPPVGCFGLNLQIKLPFWPGPNQINIPKINDIQNDHVKSRSVVLV